MTTVAREIREESGIAVTPRALLDTWVYEIDDTRRVLIVTFDCPLSERQVCQVSDEHMELRWWPIAALASLAIPAGYVRSIRRALNQT